MYVSDGWNLRSTMQNCRLQPTQENFLPARYVIHELAKHRLVERPGQFPFQKKNHVFIFPTLCYAGFV